MPRVVTLTTDFGSGSGYVAEMKGRLLHAATAFTLVDIAHDLPPHDIRAAAWLVGQACFAFPPGSLHMVVVDPGVGTARRLVWADIGEHEFLCPDNGVLTGRCARAPLAAARTLDTCPRRLRHVSRPRRARPRRGPAPRRRRRRRDRAGSRRTPHDRVAEPRGDPAAVAGEVIHVDAFGNLVTNLPAALWPRLAAAGRLRLAGHAITTHRPHLWRRRAGTLVALVGSQGFIEAAVVEGSAAERLRAGVGARR